MRYGVKIEFSPSYSDWTTCYSNCPGIIETNGVFWTDNINIAYKHRAHCEETGGYKYVVVEMD